VIGVLISSKTSAAATAAVAFAAATITISNLNPKCVSHFGISQLPRQKF